MVELNLEGGSTEVVKDCGANDRPCCVPAEKLEKDLGVERSRGGEKGASVATMPSAPDLPSAMYEGSKVVICIAGVPPTTFHDVSVSRTVGFSGQDIVVKRGDGKVVFDSAIPIGTAFTIFIEPDKPEKAEGLPRR